MAQAKSKQITRQSNVVVLPLTTLYILKYDVSVFNSYYKIGITTRTAEERCQEVKDSMGKSNDISVYWHGKFIGAYAIEQFLHTFFAPFNVQMSPSISGYTEFFDLDWVSVGILIRMLGFVQFATFSLSFAGGIWSFILLLNIILKLSQG
jgi:hypothetical protein